MKTAAARQHSQPTADKAKGGGARKPFFSTVQAKSSEEMQARMRVGRPGDRFEKEADGVADKVVDGKSVRGGLAGGITPLTQRQEDEEAQAKADQEEEKLQAKEDKELQKQEKEEAQAKEDEDLQNKAEDEETQAKPEKDEALQSKEEEETQAKADEEEPDAQRKEDEEAQARTDEEEAQTKEDEDEVQARGDGGGLSASDEVARQVRAARGRGNPIPGPVRQKLEAQFGADFSGVRIHTDSAAVLLADALKAQAFTRGNDVFFNEGKFDPSSREGEHLLAHELTHTVQQGAVQAEPANDADANVISLAPAEDAGSYDVRPEIAEAMRLARGEAGKVNAKKTGGDGKRLGWERLREYFNTAFGGPVVSEQVIDKPTLLEKTDKDGKKVRMDVLPSWCGIFTWWAMKKAGIPIPDWKLGKPGIDAMKLRPSGELPRKGDIAIDVVPYNHFGMVTGLESAKDAEGKPAKMTKVATINGNTAGDDNLGGQVQERWDPLSRWDHFLDPVGKMNLPPAPMVTVSREPTPAEAAQAEGAAAETEAKKAPVETGPRPEVEELDTGVEPPAPEISLEAPPEPDLTLPPRPDAGPAEAVAQVEQADLSGSSDEATTKFIDASPSVMAATQPALAPAIDGKMKGEQQDLADNPPVLEAKTSGVVDTPITGPDDLPIPEAQVSDGVTEADPGAIATVSDPTPQPFKGNADRDEQLDKEETGSFWDAFKNFLRGFVTGIKTKDGSIDTSAGDRPNVALEGEADTGRMETQRGEAQTSVTAQRDAQTEAFRNHPGQANIQPRMIDEQRPVAVSGEPAATIEPQADENVAAYAEAPLPQDVRDAADAKVSKTLTPNMAEARTQATDAASARDTDSKTEIDTAEQAASDMNSATDDAQRKLVVDNRGKVAKLQGDGIGEAYDHVNAFNKDAAKEQTTARKDIGEHVKSEEGKARDKLTDGEKEAEKEKVQGEKEAAEKKKKLEEEQEEESWWDRVKSAIKKAVKAITEAIDKVFTAVRNAVKTIIEKAKNAAIGLINAARNWVVDKLNKFRDWAKTQVDKYLKDTFPGLAKRINDGIDAVTDVAIKGVNAVADKAIETVTKLADGLAKALDKILSTFQTALKTAVRVVGAVMQGDFAEALRAAIEGACEIAGVDPKPVFDFLDRAGKAIMKILKDPVTFIKNLFGAVGDGIGNFFKNIKKHLIEGVIGWLTGALGEVNITGPFEFSAKGILSIVLQVLGVTYDNIKARVIKKFPASAKVFDVVEKGFALLKKLVTEGPGALWEEIKGQLANLKETVLGAIRSWLITTVIKEGIVWLLSLTNPASAIVKAIKLVFDLVMFLVERYQQIKDFIMSVYEAVAEIASGNFGKVTTAVENALSRVVPVLISLLASVMGLGGIAKQVKKVIETITKPINKAIDMVVDKIVKFAKKVLGKGKAAAKKVKEKAKETIEKIATWWKERRKFRSKDGGNHSIYYSGEAGKAELMIASKADRIETFLETKANDKNAPADQKKVASQGLTQYKKVLKSEDTLEKLRAKREKIPTSDKVNYRAATSAVNSEIRVFRNELDALSRILQNATFENDDDALVRTNVAHDAGGDKNTRALPLTYLSGNTKGSGPGQNPPGWDHAVKLDTKPDGTSYSQWVRGHLLNDNLHGPGTANNLVPITQKMNRDMESQAESPVKAAIKTKGKLYFYKSVVTFWGGSPPVSDFPQKIVVTWGEAERLPTDKTKFKEGTVKGTVPISMPTAPPATATAFVPNINGGSPGLLLAAIKKQDASVTSYFVSELLLGEYEDNGKYTSKTNMKERLWEKGGAALAAKRRQHVNATYAAITAGDVQV